ncbi:ROK family protein, partial [Xanthovirga aplysinae]|uniref:ROK family protein n=1 Tax=Xanthovirga aplysinae TaxID=2529853 RepID=UPI0012BCF020
MKDVAIGIDIGGTNTKVGFVDEKGNILSEGSFSTSLHKTIESYLNALHTNIEKQIDSMTSDINLAGIGIGAPNAHYYTGTIEDAINLNWKGKIEFVKLLKEYYDVPMALTNDANAAAIGEMVYGGAMNMTDFIMITLGTGLGSGIVTHGELLYGKDGIAGELGHTLVNVFGRHCACGRRGCLETYVSATGIKRTVYKMLADFNGESELSKVHFDELTAEMITEAAKRGDKVALESFEYTGRILGMKLADAVAHTNPEAIFLFGGLSKAEDFIFEPTQRFMEEHML